jgi:hypothetical protein
MFPTNYTLCSGPPAPLIPPGAAQERAGVAGAAGGCYLRLADDAGRLNSALRKREVMSLEENDLIVETLAPGLDER